MNLSTSGTCSFPAVQLSIGKSGRIASNSLSARIALISNPLCLYRVTTDLIRCVIVGICLLGRASTVPNFRFLEIVTRNATLLMNIISIVRMIDRCVWIISGGTPSTPMPTWGLVATQFSLLGPQDLAQKCPRPRQCLLSSQGNP